MGIHAGNCAEVQASIWNSSSSAPPASQSNASPSQGMPSAAVPSKASGSTTRLIQGTATRLARGPLRLTGNANASSSGARPRPITHWARHQVIHQRHAPRRPAKARTSRATAPKDSQKPGCSTTRGSAASTTQSAASNGVRNPRWRKRRRQSRTTASITQALLTGTSNPARIPYPSPPAKARAQAQGSQGRRLGQSPNRARTATRP
ncbi:hypothetical protein D9M72_477220 [compost metagenome]